MAGGHERHTGVRPRLQSAGISLALLLKQGHRTEPYPLFPPPPQQTTIFPITTTSRLLLLQRYGLLLHPPPSLLQSPNCPLGRFNFPLYTFQLAVHGYGRVGAVLTQQDGAEFVDLLCGGGVDVDVGGWEWDGRR